MTAISQLGTGGQSGTALYGAVKMASDDLHTAPAQRRIMILLTDGASQSDTATLDEALKPAKQAGVTVYPIGIATTRPAQAVLDQIAKATGGTAASRPTRRPWPASTAPSRRELGTSYTYLYQSSAAPGAPIKLELSRQGLGTVEQALKAPGQLAPADQRAAAA